MLVFRFTFRFIALLVAVLMVFPLIILLILTSQKINNRHMNKKVVSLWSKLLCFVCGIKLTVKGEKHKNPVLIVANHTSWLDIPIIHSQKLVGFVAKKEIESWPLLGLIVKSGETLFIARGKHESRKEVIEIMQKRLKEGRSIGVFPEGKATNGKVLGRFHRQLLYAATEQNIPIQAIAIKLINKDGTRNENIAFRNKETFLMNVLRILCLPGSTAQINFCEPLLQQGITAREAAQITQKQVAEKLAKNDYM